MRSDDAIIRIFHLNALDPTITRSAANSEFHRRSVAIPCISAVKSNNIGGDCIAAIACAVCQCDFSN